MNNIESHISIQYFQHTYAEFILGSYNNALCLCDFRYRNMRNAVDRRVQQSLNANFVEQPSDVIEMTKVQLNDYFVGKKTELWYSTDNRWLWFSKNRLARSADHWLWHDGFL